MSFLFQIQSPYIEEYLKYTATIQVLPPTHPHPHTHPAHTQDDNRLILDLLWRYYERNKNYAAAAQILDKIAHTEGYVSITMVIIIIIT